MKQRKNNGKSNKAQGGFARNEKRFFNSEVDGKTVKVERRRCTLVNSITASTGQAAAYSANSSAVSASFEFSNYALLYQEYRVRSIRTRVVFRMRDNIQDPSAVPYPGAIVTGGYTNGTGGATQAAIFASSGGKVTPEWVVSENIVTWENNPNAKLWTPTSGTIATANQYGVQFLSSGLAPSFYASVTVADTFTEFDVEFRTRQ